MNNLAIPRNEELILSELQALQAAAAVYHAFKHPALCAFAIK